MAHVHRILRLLQRQREHQFVRVYSPSRKISKSRNTKTTRWNVPLIFLTCLSLLILQQRHPLYHLLRDFSILPQCNAQRFPRRRDDNNKADDDDDDGIDDDSTITTPFDGNNNDSRNSNAVRNVVLELKQQGWQLVAHRSEFSADELPRVSPSHQVDALLPTTSFGEFTDSQVCEVYSTQNGEGQSTTSSRPSSTEPPTLPPGSHASFERPFRNLQNNLATEIMFRTGDKPMTDQLYAVADYASIHEALTNDADFNSQTTAKDSSSSSTSRQQATALSDGSLITKVDFWFHDSVGRMFYTPGHVHNRRSLHVSQQGQDQYYDNTEPMGPLITLDARHVGGLGSILLLWGDSRDLEDVTTRQQLLEPYVVVSSDKQNEDEINTTTNTGRNSNNTTASVVDDDEYDENETTDIDLILLSELRNGVNVLVRGNLRSSINGGNDEDEGEQQSSDVGLLHRNPLLERGWELVAHVSSRGTSHKSFFGGNAALMSNYRYNTQHFTWAPHPSTPDFAVPFPSTYDVCVAAGEEEKDDEWELMFVTGDASLWVLIQRYDDLRQIIDAKESDYLPNFDFLIGLPNEGIVQKTRGNILSKPPTLNGRGRTRESSEFADGSPWISFEGSHMYGVRHERMIWGEDNDAGLMGDGNGNSMISRDGGGGFGGSSRGQQQTGYTSLKTRRGGINVYVRPRALWEREQETSAIAGGYYYMTDDGNEDENYQGFFPCRKNGDGLSDQDEYGYVDTNDKTGGQGGGDDDTVIDEPLLPGEDGERSSTPAPTPFPTFSPTESDSNENEEEDNQDGRLNGGIVELVPGDPTPSPSKDNDYYNDDDDKVLITEEETLVGNGDDGVSTDDPNADRRFRAKVITGAAISAVVFSFFLSLLLYQLQRECLRRRRSGHRGPSWGRKVQTAAGAIVTQSKRYFDMFDNNDDDSIMNDEEGVRMKSTFDVGDEVSSIGTPIHLSSTSDDRSSIADDDVSPNHRTSPSRTKRSINTKAAAIGGGRGDRTRGGGGGADESLATYDDDYYQANIGFGNETVVSSVGGTYGTGTVRDGNNSQFDSDTISRGGFTFMTGGTIFPALKGTSSVGVQSLTSEKMHHHLQTNGDRKRQGTISIEDNVLGPEDIILRKRLKEQEEQKKAADDMNTKCSDDDAAEAKTEIFICEFTVSSDDEASFEDQFLRCSSQDTPEVEHRKKIEVAAPAPAIGTTTAIVDPISYYTEGVKLPPASFDNDDLCASSSSDDEDGSNGFFARSDSQDDFYTSPLNQSKSQDTIDIIHKEGVVQEFEHGHDDLQIQTGADEWEHGKSNNFYFPRSPHLQRRKRSEGRAGGGGGGGESDLRSPQTPRLSNLQQKKKVRSPSPSGHPASVIIPSTASLQRSKSEGMQKLNLSLSEITGQGVLGSTVGVSSPRLSPRPKHLLSSQRGRSNGSATMSDKDIPLSPDISSSPDVSALEGLPVFRRASSGLRLLNKPLLRSQSFLGLGSDGSTKAPQALAPPSLSWVTTDNLEDVEVLDVQVGPGRLGVVLEDNPFIAPGEKGPPIFASIKETSVVTNMILPNDALVRVDDEDCTQFDAIRVSRLIKRKQNSCRKFTIVRNHYGSGCSGESISGESSSASRGDDGEVKGSSATDTRPNMS